MLLFPDKGSWRFDASRIAETIRSLWPESVIVEIPRCSEQLFTHQVDSHEVGLFDVGPTMMVLHVNRSIDDASRAAFEACRTAPPSVRFHYMDEGKNCAMRVSSETPLAEFMRILDRGPV